MTDRIQISSQPSGYTVPNWLREHKTHGRALTEDWPRIEIAFGSESAAQFFRNLMKVNTLINTSVRLSFYEMLDEEDFINGGANGIGFANVVEELLKHNNAVDMVVSYGEQWKLCGYVHSEFNKDISDGIFTMFVYHLSVGAF